MNTEYFFLDFLSFQLIFYMIKSNVGRLMGVIKSFVTLKLFGRTSALQPACG